MAVGRNGVGTKESSQLTAEHLLLNCPVDKVCTLPPTIIAPAGVDWKMPLTEQMTAQNNQLEVLHARSRSSVIRLHQSSSQRPSALAPAQQVELTMQPNHYFAQ